MDAGAYMGLFALLPLLVVVAWLVIGQPAVTRHGYYRSAEDHAQADLLERVPARMRAARPSSAWAHELFSGMYVPRGAERLELYPHELYMYVQVYSQGRLVREYVEARL